MSKHFHTILHSRLLMPMIFFGLAGAIWGLEAYRGTVGSGETFTNPFSYILGAVALAVCGGAALAYTRGLQAREAVKIIGFGLVGWLAAFLVPAVWVEPLANLGAFSVSFILGLLSKIEFISIELLDAIYLRTGLYPYLHFGNLWIEFLFTGAVVGFAYALILRTKIIRTVSYTAIGFSIPSILSPILGNLSAYLFVSTFATYLLTFFTVGVISGLSLALAINQKEEGGSIPV